MASTLGERIAAARKSKQMTQEQFANLLYVSRQTISNWENNRSIPDYNTLQQIMQLLEMHSSTLFETNDPAHSSMQKSSPATAVAPKQKRHFPIQQVLLLMGILLLLVASCIWGSNAMQKKENVAKAVEQKALFMQARENNPSQAFLKIWTDPHPIPITQYITEALPTWNYRLYLKEENGFDVTVQQIDRILFFQDGTCTNPLPTGDHFGFFTYWGSNKIHGNGVRSLTMVQEQEAAIIGVGIAVHILDANGNNAVFRTYADFLQ